MFSNLSFAEKQIEAVSKTSWIINHRILNSYFCQTNILPDFAECAHSILNWMWKPEFY